MKLVAPITIATGSTLVSTNAGTTGDPAAWSNATTYAAGVQATQGETIYQSAQAANTNHDPATAGNVPTWWVVVGAVNKMAMFDTRVGSQTVNADTIGVAILPGAVVDTVSLRNVDCNLIAVIQNDPVDGQVFAQTQNMVEDVGDWWEYLYSPIVQKTDALFTGILPYRNSTITIVIDKTGATARCGLCVVGQSLDAGGASYGSSDGIQDYSLVQPNAWGIRDIVERDYSDEADINLMVRADLSPYFRRTLAARRARPTLLVLADHRPDAQYYGLISFRRTFSLPNHDAYTVNVKGYT
jgi:hypothetical protein